MPPGDRSGARSRALFFGPPGRRRYGVLHAPEPAVPPQRQGWLFLPAWGEERDTAGRIVRELAEALAARGYWCLRYDPVGSGNSEGAFEAVTVADQLRDVPLAVRTLERLSGVPCGALFGLRWGATLAVEARARNGWDVPLALWAPIVSGRRHVDELLRVVLAGRLTARSEQPPSREDLRHELATGATLAVRGHALTAAGVAAFEATDLAASPGGGRGPALVVQLDRRPDRPVRAELQALGVRLGAEGPTTLARASGVVPWVLTNTDYDVRPAALFGPTLAWADEHVAPRRPERPLAGDVALPADIRGREPTTDDEQGEQVVSFDLDGQTLRGVLHEPDPRRFDLPPARPPDRPIVVLPVMSALFPVALARALGAAGWASLRFDPRGKGDSDGHLDFPTVARLHFAVQGGLLVPDLHAAVRFATDELGHPAAIPVGICGDALTAVYLAAAEPRVCGLAPLELPLLTTPQRDESASGPGLPSRLAEQLRAHGHGPGEQVERALRRVRWAWRRGRETLRRLATRDHDTSPSHALAGRLGERANEPLLAALAACVARGLPLLLLYGSQRLDGPSGLDRVLPLLEATHPDGARRLRHRLVEGADHHFSAPEHAAEVQRELLAWLSDPLQPWNPR